MWLLSNSWKFLCQILYTYSAGSCPLMCCFSRKLLYIYEIDIMPNFKFGFCNCTSLFLRDVTFCRIIFKFTGKNWTLNSIKLTRKCIDVHDRQWNSKLVAVGRKRREQLTHACCLACCYSFAARSTFLAVRAVLAYNYHFVCYSVTVHEHEYVYSSTLWSSVSIFSVNLPITVRNVTSRNKYSDV